MTMKKKKGINEFMVFTGNANPELAKGVCKYLDVPLGEGKVRRFSDGEIQIEIEENVRQREVFVVQPTCHPVNENLVELLLMIDAFKRASAKPITAVIPYYGYARQDKKVAPRVPISAKLVADMITVAGAHRVIVMELHAGQIQGFFNIPVDNLFIRPLVIDYLRGHYDGNLVIVSPDAGGVERARGIAKEVNAGLAIIDKRREEPNKAKAMKVVGDVAGKTVVILDDMVDTAGTLCEAAEALILAGAIAVYAICVHPVLSGKAIEKICSSPIKDIIVTDSIPLSEKAVACGKIQVISLVDLIGETMLRSFTGDSVTSLFL